MKYLIILIVPFLLTGCLASWRPVPDHVSSDLGLEKEADTVQRSAVNIDGMTDDRGIEAETVILKTVATSLYDKAAINKKTVEYIEKVEKQLKAYEANEKRRVTTIFIILYVLFRVPPPPTGRYGKPKRIPLSVANYAQTTIVVV